MPRRASTSLVPRHLRSIPSQVISSGVCQPSWENRDRGNCCGTGTGWCGRARQISSPCELTGRYWRDDRVPRDLVVGDALFDLGHQLRRVALDHFPDFWPELMEEINPCIAANRRTKSL